MSHLKRRRAFTLVELLVVIGIIAVLIGILLPTLSKVQSRGRALKCQANLRGIGQLLQTYMAENRGSLPYGETYERFNPEDGTQAAGNNGRLTSWASWATKLSRSSSQASAVFTSATIKQALGDFLKCPEAEQVGQRQLVHYAAHIVAMPVPVAENTVDRSPVGYRATGYGDRPIRAPARADELHPFNILVHDTQVLPPPPGYPSPEWDGWLVNADADNQAIWYGGSCAPGDNFRYFFERDRLARVGPGIAGNNKPYRHNVGSFTWRNIDPDPYWNVIEQYPYQGNVRYRHSGDNVCNCLFADWSVQPMRLKEKDLLIKHFRIKPLSNVPINPSFPN